MGDAADSFRAIKALRQYERAQKRESAPAQLTAANICYRSFNDGAHMRIYAKGFDIDFWPGTGRWKVCGSDKSRHGIESLIDFCT